MKDLSTKLLNYFFLCAAILLAGTGTVKAAEIKVCKTCPVSTVAAALKQAKPHDRILVQTGTYNESGLVIDKPLSLIGIKNP
ncbi:MAG: hypothetical protein LPK19_03360, partial [Hymenobacteraceae bacterium]|nr:hypothetical protein [Hymenobacteraceae bacterium]MDX5395230.1 hypothetical protein [Hymenobacteraceae bacterium]MDX5511268.1 hypothetical protein [Hymenobacteraceae bacterium]